MQRFFAEGPGASGVDMDSSIKLMEQYNDEFKLLEQQRQEFGKANSSCKISTAHKAIERVFLQL